MKRADLEREVYKTMFKFQKHSPEILLLTGVVGVIGAAVLACVETTKAVPIVNEAKKKVEEIQSADREDDFDESKAIKKTYTGAGLRIVQTYAPSVVIGAVSITAILASHGIMKQRNVALAAAYAAVDQSFKAYQKRVAERFGEDVEQEIRYNIKKEKFEETITDAKGKEKKVKKETEVAGDDSTLLYARIFKNGNDNWTRNEDYNRLFLVREEEYANSLLVRTGHLFLNDVYKRLGIDEVPEGQIVGWRYDMEHPTGDNMVSFNIRASEQVDGKGGFDPVFLLDFNVDGPIWDLL